MNEIAEHELLLDDSFCVPKIMVFGVEPMETIVELLPSNGYRSSSRQAQLCDNICLLIELRLVTLMQSAVAV